MGIPERWRGLPPIPVDIERRLARLPEVLAGAGVRVAYLFGSLARGEAADDVDIAIEAGGDSAMSLGEEIARVLGTDRIDLVDLTEASPVLQFHVVREGRLLYAASEDDVREVELSAIREYRDTTHHRAIHDAYVRERAAG